MQELAKILVRAFKQTNHFSPMDNVTYGHMVFISKGDGPPKVSILRIVS